GASPYQVVNTIADIKAGAQADLAAWEAFLKGDYYGALEDMGVSSLYYADAYSWYMSTKVDLFARTNVFFTDLSHFDLHTASTWNSIVGPCGLTSVAKTTAPRHGAVPGPRPRRP